MVFDSQTPTHTQVPGEIDIGDYDLGLPERPILEVPSQLCPNSFLSSPWSQQPFHPPNRAPLQSHDTSHDGVMLFDVESGEMQLHSEGA